MQKKNRKINSRSIHSQEEEKKSLGHVSRIQMRLLQLIMQGRISGKRNVGRCKTFWLRNIYIWFAFPSTELFRTAILKVRIPMVITGLALGGRQGRELPTAEKPPELL